MCPPDFYLRGRVLCRAHVGLLDIIGSGKIFTMANAIGRLNRLILVIAYNKTLVAQFYGELKDFSLRMRRSILCLTITKTNYIQDVRDFKEIKFIYNG